jgi:hypothetical protein
MICEMPFSKSAIPARCARDQLEPAMQVFDAYSTRSKVSNQS